MLFYCGLHQPSDAQHFPRCMISINRLRTRVSDFPATDWMLDSGAYTEIDRYHKYHTSPETYAAQVRRWSTCGRLLAASSQDYMCEPHILAKTQLTIADHQRLTIERYDAIAANVGDATYVLPVLQGYAPTEYVAHIEQYGDRLRPGAWVGVGSVCKRNGDPDALAAVLLAIKAARPDLRLHGFGVKLTALKRPSIRACLSTADSLSWSFQARKQGRNQNDWREAKRFCERIETLCIEPEESEI